MPNPAMINGGRYTRGENNGDRRAKTTAKKSSGEILLRLWQYLGKNRSLLILSIILSLSSNILALLGPKLSGMAINAIEAGKGKVDIAYVLRICLWMLVFYCSSAALAYILSRVILRMSKNVIQIMRQDVFQNLVRLPVSYFDQYQTGDILSIITYDIDTVNQSLSADFLQILQTVVTVVVSLVMMITIAPRLVLVFFITVPMTILVTKKITAWVKPLFKTRSIKLGALNGFTEEMLGGQKTIRAYGREAAVLEQFDQKNHDAAEAYTTAEGNGSVVGPTVNFINNMSLAAVCILGAVFYLNGMVGLGDLSSFVQYSRKFSGPINEVANIVGELQSALSAAERVFTLMDAEPEKADVSGAETLCDVHGEVELRDISFGYTPDKEIIHHFHMHAAPGSLIAIVGPTGAGKTTIINLLMRFYDPQCGKILLDGKDIQRISRKSLRKSYSMVLQDTWLFSGTVYDNIAYGKPDATRDEVIAAAKSAHVHHFIEAMPKGYDTILSDNGSGISKGQKQLLTIARAMLLDSPMLILDEATSNVDTQTERSIQAAMRELMKDKTCFVIAHRLSTIQNADLILVMKDGSVVEQGTHKELLARSGFYAQLYNAQFDTFQ